MAGTALLFPGQGSHAADMDAAWRGTPLFERGLELLGYDPFADLGMGTRVQQPAIFLVCACAWDAHDEGQEGDREAWSSPPPGIRSASTRPCTRPAR